MSDERCITSTSKSTSKAPVQGRIVRPELVSEKSFVENVAGFINEVTPTSSTNTDHFDNKETVEWVKFENFDLNDKCFGGSNGVLPLLLIIGYTKGVQGWLVPDNGEAQEVFSWRRNSVRCVKLLPSPLLVDVNSSSVSHDFFGGKRPLIAVCDDATKAGSQSPYNILTFESLKSGDVVKTYKFQHPIINIEANRRVVVVCFPERLAVLSATTLDERLTVTTCYPAPSPSLNPIAIGESWLAYSDRKLHPHYSSGGGACLESSRSYKATVMQYAKSFSKNILDLKDTLLGGTAAPKHGTVPYGGSSAHSSSPPISASVGPGSGYTPGVVTVLDIEKAPSGDVNLNQSNVKGIVAHFTAHHGYPVVAMQFDQSGCLLLTADEPGHYFNVFRLHPHPTLSSMSAVHHLFSLHRGDTTATVVDVSFSFDSRWVAVSTMRGTTHVFPMTPYGGDITQRTHTSPCVVNKQSRYERSVRLDENQSSSGKNSPSTSSSASSNPAYHMCTSDNCCTALAYHNPRVPPYPMPCDLSPYVQLRQPLLANLLGSMGASPTLMRSGSQAPSHRGAAPQTETEFVRVTSTFGPPRGWVAGSPISMHGHPSHLPGSSCTEGRFSLAASDALYVMAYHGNLIQYSLQPRPVPHKTAGSYSSGAISLEAHAVAQWSLLREADSAEVKLPLLNNNPLLHIPTQPSPLPQSSLPHHSSHTAFSPSTSSPEDVDAVSWPGELDIITHGGPDRRNCLGPQFVLRPEVFSFAETEHSTNRFSRSSPVDIQGGPSPILVESSSFGSGSYSASPSLVERMSCLHMGSSSDITSQIQSQISDALEDDPNLSTANAGGSHQDDLESYFGGRENRVMEEYEGPFGTVVGRRTPSMTSRWSGSSHSLEDVEGGPEHRVYARIRQLSASQYPSYHPPPPPPQLPLYPVLPPTVTTSNVVVSGSCVEEEFRGLTSSAEELSTTFVSSSLHHHHAKGASKSKEAWLPASSNVWADCPPPKKDNLSLDLKGGGVIGTSDDDAFAKTEVKKERKKKKKSKESESPPQDVPAEGGADSLMLTTHHFNPSPPEEPTRDDEAAMVDVSLCIDENQDHSIPVTCTFDEHGNLSAGGASSEAVLDNLDFELQADNHQEEEENGNKCVVRRRPRSSRTRLISEHGDDDLARALEEARSDDDTHPHTPPSPPTVRKNFRVSENFPYRVSSSDEEDKAPAKEVRAVVAVPEWPCLGRGGLSTGEDATSTDDNRGETSGEDKRHKVGGASSESSEPSTVPVTVKNKKKKKKKR